MFCENCGKEIDNDTKFCPNCGKEIEAKVIPNETKTDIQSAITIDEKKVKHCSACGSIISIKAKQCPKCGEKNKIPLKHRKGLLTFIAIALCIVLIIVYNFVKVNIYNEPSTYKTIDYSTFLQDCMTDIDSAEEKYVGECYSFTGRYLAGSSFLGKRWSVSKLYDYNFYSSGTLVQGDSLLTINAEFKSMKAKSEMPSPKFEDMVIVKGKITNIHYDEITDNISISLTVYESKIN